MLPSLVTLSILRRGENVHPNLEPRTRLSGSPKGCRRMARSPRGESMLLFVNSIDETFLFQLDDEPVVDDVVDLHARAWFARQRERFIDLDFHSVPRRQRHALEEFSDGLVRAFQIGFVRLA